MLSCHLPVVSASFFFCYRRPKLPDNVVALGEQRIRSTLPFGDVRAHVELPVNSHVVDRVELVMLASVLCHQKFRPTFMLYG